MTNLNNMNANTIELKKNESSNISNNSKNFIKSNHQTINTTGVISSGIIHRKSGSCADFNANNNQEKGATLNVLTGQIVTSNEQDSLKKRGDFNTIEENYNKINEVNEEQNFNEFINEFENEENLIKNNILYTASTSKVVKYYDYINKFGLVYLISSESNYIGVCFNDFSTLIQNSSLAVTDNKSKNLYTYIDKDHKNVINFDEIGLENFIKDKIQNKEMSKKCEIMKQIILKYSQELSELKPIYEGSSGNNENNLLSDISKIVFLKDFIKVQQAILLRLSNKLIQIIFADQTEILMSTESTDFIYRNKNGEEIFDSIQSVMSSDSTEIIKRIKFSKNLMVHFLKTFKSNSGGTNQLKKK